MQRFQTPIDMRGNQILNLRAENVATLPAAGVVGRVVWLTTEDRAYFDTGADWVAVVTGAVQTSPTDTTAGALMAFGAFGLGVAVAEPTDWNNLVNPGFYNVVNGKTNQPATGFNWACVVAQGTNSNNVVQIAYRISDPVVVYHRARNGGTWTPWVGEVEQGSNANGTFYKYPDGRLECFHRIDLGSVIFGGAGTFASPYYTDAATWTYPHVFIAPPNVHLTPEPEVGVTFLGRFLGANFSRCDADRLVTIRAHRTTSVSTDSDVILQLSAFGRWKI